MKTQVFNGNNMSPLVKTTPVVKPIQSYTDLAFSHTMLLASMVSPKNRNHKFLNKIVEF